MKKIVYVLLLFDEGDGRHYAAGVADESQTLRDKVEEWEERDSMEYNYLIDATEYLEHEERE